MYFDLFYLLSVFASFFPQYSEAFILWHTWHISSVRHIRLLASAVLYGSWMLSECIPPVPQWNSPSDVFGTWSGVWHMKADPHAGRFSITPLVSVALAVWWLCSCVDVQLAVSSKLSESHIQSRSKTSSKSGRFLVNRQVNVCPGMPLIALLSSGISTSLAKISRSYKKDSV